MKKFLSVFIFLILSATAVFAQDDYEAPVPAADDEVTQSGPNTKFTVPTLMRYDAFQNAEIAVPIDFSEDRFLVKLYKIADNNDYLQKVKIPNARVTEYTNGTYSIKFKDTPNTIFYYDKTGELTSFAKVTNAGKVPFVTYYYDTKGQILQVEIKPQYYRSYVYGLDGVLLQYNIDDKLYDVSGKILRRKKSFF